MNKYINKLEKINYIYKIPELKNIIEEMYYDETLKELSKNNIKKDQLKSAKNILKNAKGIYEKQFYKNGKYCLCDGYVLAVLNEKIEGIPTEEKDLESYINYQNVFPTLDLEEIKINKEEIIKEAKKTNKRIKYCEFPFTLKFNNIEKGVNAKFLLNMIYILGGFDKVIIKSDKSEISPFVLESELGKGMVLPIKLPKAQEVE